MVKIGGDAGAGVALLPPAHRGGGARARRLLQRAQAPLPPPRHQALALPQETDGSGAQVRSMTLSLTRITTRVSVPSPTDAAAARSSVRRAIAGRLCPSF
eukprot:SM004989S17347  [mRNA]  locus=s4989:113:636:+ [translate_table: standard]